MEPPKWTEQQPPQNWRKFRANKLVHTVQKAGPDLWTVQSSTKIGRYRVDDEDGWKCNCPDHILRRLDCKHILAVRLHLEMTAIKEEEDDATPSTTFHSPTVMNNQVRDWSAYNRAQMEEWESFGRLLRDLTIGLEDAPQARGRPRLPLSTRAFCAVLKVYSQQSARRSQGLYERAVQAEQLAKSPHWNTASKFFNDEGAYDILRELIRQSALPLAAIEHHLSVDASGFRCSTYSQWAEKKWGAKYGEKKKVDWMKCHIISGRLTNIVADATVTRNFGKNSSDYSQFQELLENAADGFDVKEVSADKAYSGRTNIDAAGDVGATPFIPFKINARPKSLGSYMWKKAFRFFQLHEEEFLDAYHKRSNVETTFACIKRKFNENVKSKTVVAQKNEVLAKVLAYNITCLIRAMHEFGIGVDFLTPKETV